MLSSLLGLGDFFLEKKIEDSRVQSLSHAPRYSWVSPRVPLARKWSSETPTPHKPHWFSIHTMKLCNPHSVGMRCRTWALDGDTAATYHFGTRVGGFRGGGLKVINGYKIKVSTYVFVNQTITSVYHEIWHIYTNLHWIKFSSYTFHAFKISRRFEINNHLFFKNFKFQVFVF